MATSSTPADGLLDLPPLTVVRGGPGAGKSTFLARLVAEAASAGLSAGPLLVGGLTGSRAVLLTLDDIDELEATTIAEAIGAIRVALAENPRVRVVVTSGSSTPLDREARVIDLPPLRDDEAAALVRQGSAYVSPLLVDHLVREAGGNPALLTRAAAAVASGAGERDVLSLPPRHASLTGRVLAAAPGVRAVLADLSVRDEGVVTASAPDDPILAEFTRAGLAGELIFASPVHRLAVRRALPVDLLREAHERAARDVTLPAEIRAWHAACGEGTGDLLAAWADEGSFPLHRRVEARVESARRAVDAGLRAERSARAVLEAALAGDLVLAEELLTSGPVGIRHLPAARIGGALIRLLSYGDPRGARALLEAATESPEQRRAGIAVATLLTVLLGGDDDWAWWTARARSEPDATVRRIADLRRGERSSEDSLPAPESADLDVQLLEALAGVFEGNGAWRSEMRSHRVVRRSHLARAVRDLDVASRQLRAGRWAEAATILEACAERCDSAGMAVLARAADGLGALAAALLGQSERASRLAQAALFSHAARELPVIAFSARHALLHHAVLEQDVDAAFVQFAAVDRLGPHDPIDPALWLIDLADLAALDPAQEPVLEGARRQAADAAIRAGQGFAKDYAEASGDVGRRVLRFQELVASARTLASPCEIGRTLHRMGIALFEAGRDADARRAFAEAQSEFTAAGALGWAARAGRRREEARLLPLPSVTVPISVPLTEQEERIAALAASGLSNKEIGRRLYLSPRTVGGHLYNVFPKLGITSRAALRDALLRREGLFPERAASAS